VIRERELKKKQAGGLKTFFIKAKAMTSPILKGKQSCGTSSNSKYRVSTPDKHIGGGSKPYTPTPPKESSNSKNNLSRVKSSNTPSSDDFQSAIIINHDIQDTCILDNSNNATL
jgi:hypothetical protein